MAPYERMTAIRTTYRTVTFVRPEKKLAQVRP